MTSADTMGTRMTRARSKKAANSNMKMPTLAACAAVRQKVSVPGAGPGSTTARRKRLVAQTEAQHVQAWLKSRDDVSAAARRDVPVKFVVVVAVAREGVENGSVALQLGEPSKFITGAGIHHREIIRAAVQRGRNGGLGLWPEQHRFHCQALTIPTRPKGRLWTLQECLRRVKDGRTQPGKYLPGYHWKRTLLDTVGMFQTCHK